MRWKKLAPLLFIFLWPLSLYSQMKVVYPNINGLGSDAFGFAALDLALEKSGIDYDLYFDAEEMTNRRIRERIINGQISVADFGTSPEFEEQLLPVYIPIDLGLNGWRLLAICEERADDFASIETIEDLKMMTAGQGRGWSDTAILRAAGLKVMEGPQIGNLMRMVSSGRFDYFPLGANEIHSLIDSFGEEAGNVIVEESLVLIYPFGRLFFVNRDNKTLAEAIHRGLVTAMRDGSFMELFRNHRSNRDLFTKADLKDRKIIYIDNPFMTENFRRIPEEFFFEAF